MSGSPTGSVGAANTAGGQPGAAQGQAQNAPASAQAAKMVKVLVDGVEVEADSRDNLIEAARRVGVAIPYFCYHPRLSIAGQCRMCLVETSDAPGRLVPGCQVRVKEGLKIVTTTPAVKDNQRGSMEFHLINHPVDCAICDQSGECKLQDYYMEYDHQPSRIRTYKLNKPKREVFGPMVVYDAERCIMCTRCVRFMDEIAQEPQLAVVQRGSHSLISTFPGQPLDSKYSGNTVDICPVGALLNRDFRFQSRVWFVDKTPTVCTGCSNGCNVYGESRGEVMYRLLPRRNEEVNQVWMCDEGRLTYHETNEKRVEWARGPSRWVRGSRWSGASSCCGRSWGSRESPSPSPRSAATRRRWLPSCWARCSRPRDTCSAESLRATATSSSSAPTRTPTCWA
jgi:NADH-quinone oxidoreductase subunit G